MVDSDCLDLLSRFAICTFDHCTTATVVTASVVFAVVLGAMALTSMSATSPFLAKFQCRTPLCFLCPPESSIGQGDDDEDDDSIRDTGILFLPKRAANQSFETSALTGTSHDGESDEDEIVGVVAARNASPRRKISLDPSINTSDSTLKQGQHATHTTRHTGTAVHAAAIPPSIEETKGSVDENRFDKTQKSQDDDDDDDCFFKVECAGKYECEDDDRSDASSLTMPSFRPKNGAAGSPRSLAAKSKVLQKVSRAVIASVKALKSKKNAATDANNGIVIENVEPCSCLVLLIDPSSHTFEILPVQYFPGVSSVSDILEQIPLQSSFNFRLRFQTYTGLMEVVSKEDRSSRSFQLPQSKPVPMRYSCEFYHDQQQQPLDAKTTSKSGVMMPLVAILPEKVNGRTTTPSKGEMTGAVNMVETTERLARKLLSEPRVLERLRYLQDAVLSSPSEDESDEEAKERR